MCVCVCACVRVCVCVYAGEDDEKVELQDSELQETSLNTHAPTIRKTSKNVALMPLGDQRTNDFMVGSIQITSVPQPFDPPPPKKIFVFKMNVY